MIDISIDISDKVNSYNISEGDINSLTNYMLDRIVDTYEQQWNKFIDSELGTTRNEYRSAIYTERPDDKTAIIGLSVRDSKLAIMLEEGASDFDIKEGFSKSDKRVVKDNGGWYLTIPFRHATSEVVVNSVIGDILPKNIYDIAKGNEGNPITKQQLPEGFNEVQTHKITLNTGSILEYTHKSPIFEGLVRKNISSTDKEKRGGYFTFRRVSDKSDDNSWIHPGLQPKKLMEKTMNIVSVDIDKMVSEIFEDFMNINFK